MNLKTALVLLPALAAQCACASSPDSVPLLKYGGTMKKLDVTAGGAAYPFLFDTGGGETVLTNEMAARVCGRIYGRGVGYRMHGEKLTYQKCGGVNLRIGKTELFHPAVAVFDLMSLLPPEAPKIYGVVSLSSFRDRVVYLDLPAGRLTIETGKSAKEKKKRMTLLESRFRNGLSGEDLAILLAVRRGGEPYWFLFDTGNGHRTLISPRTAFDWKLQDDPAAVGAIHRAELSFGTLSGTFDVQADDIIYDGVLDYGVISQKRYLIDFPARQIWME